ncbi:alcohol dehydrogenase [Trichoderma guizhouense]|uniref:Alcohol dehydrogenase n=1 Tax=Trichoderma guizhouense TaxID=1491466 RepID=A0A1T3CD74_9HYPO|nr:alcohol dehydrogenase [Trichoderma guizhouense]
MASAQLPTTYKAVILTEPGAPFKLHDVKLQHPGPGQVLVKILACGVCFSDIAVAQGHLGDVFPRTPGHELVGDVVELGKDVNRFTIGERVGGPWHGGHDGSCRQCQKGRFQMCEHQTINGVTQDGGFAEYVLLRQEAIVRIPKEMNPAEAAPLLCAGVTVFNGIRKLQVEQGAIVAIQGLGGLGHLAVQYASKMGYEVAVLSSGDDKAAFAMQLGAHHYINTKKVDGPTELAKLGGASIIVQTAPNPDIIGRLVDGLAPGGKLLCLAPVGGVEFDTAVLVNGGRSVHGWPSGHAIDSEEAIQFAQLHGIKCMVEEYALTNVQEAIDSLLAGKPRFRNVLVMK